MPQRKEIPGLSMQTIPSGAIFSWHNREISINRLLFAGYLSGWLLAAPLAVFLTASLIRDLLRWGQGLPTGPAALAISAAILTLFWGIVWFLSFAILRWTWQETLQVDEKGVRIRFTGSLAPKETLIARDEIWRISFERLRTRREQEASYTLNVFHGDSRETLAFWMAKPEKEILFQLLQKTIENQGWDYVDFRSGENGAG